MKETNVMILHIYRMLLIHIFNIFSGMHFFGIKRFIFNMIPGMSAGNRTRIVGPIWAGSVSQIIIGDDSFVNRQFSVEGNGKINIGNNVDIGPGVRILTGGHKIGEAAHRAGEGVSYSINICDGCWIGAYSIILGNTTIYKGCIVGAGTIVKNDAPANTLIVGKAGSVKKDLALYD